MQTEFRSKFGDLRGYARNFQSPCGQHSVLARQLASMLHPHKRPAGQIPGAISDSAAWGHFPETRLFGSYALKTTGRTESSEAALIVRAANLRLRVIVRFHLDQRAHPWMNAALEAMIADAKSVHVRLGARRHVNSGGTLRSRLQTEIERGNASTAKLGHLSKGMGSATPVSHFHGLVGLDLEISGVVPRRRMSNRCVRQRRPQ